MPDGGRVGYKGRTMSDISFTRIWRCRKCGAVPFKRLEIKWGNGRSVTTETNRFMGSRCTCGNAGKWDENGPWDVENNPLVIWSEKALEE